MRVEVCVFSARILLDNDSKGNFYFCYVGVRGARVCDIYCLCLCFVRVLLD